MQIIKPGWISWKKIRAKKLITAELFKTMRHPRLIRILILIMDMINYQRLILYNGQSDPEIIIKV